jgi:hypothetical protein
MDQREIGEKQTSQYITQSEELDGLVFAIPDSNPIEPKVFIICPFFFFFLLDTI